MHEIFYPSIIAPKIRLQYLWLNLLENTLHVARLIADLFFKTQAIVEPL
jgi:hypothetical protein